MQAERAAIPHNRPTLGEEERQSGARVLASGWLAQGQEVEAFENELCAFLGLPEGHGVAVSSGTAALFLGLVALDARGATVGCPVYACSALPNAIRLVGAEPRFLDVRDGEPNIDPGVLGRSGLSFAIVPHMYGIPIDLSPLRDLRVVEDCAQSLGARMDGRPLGLQGDVGIFSFYATKLITTGGQGGMLVSRDRALAEVARDYRNFDGRHDRKARFNFQMTDLQAAIGRAQLRQLPAFLERRAAIFERYRAAGLDVLWAQTAGTPVRYRTVVRTQAPRKLIDRLAAAGVTAIVPIEDWELLADPGEYPNAAALTRTTISLPTYPSLGDDGIARIIDALKDDE